jgi:hypothetical protein
MLGIPMAVEITGGKKEKTVGEKIELKVNYTKEWGVLKSVEWTIPGTVVRNYTDNATKAEVTQLPDADKKKLTPLVFYWVDGADGRKVEAKCVFTSAGKDTDKTLSATFDVKAPAASPFSGTVDTVGLDPAAAPTYLKFGIAKEGIKWDWKITVPSTHDGWVKDVQTVQVKRKRTTAAGKKQVWTIPGTKVPPPSDQLDTDNPYSLAGDYPPCPGFPQKVSAGGSFSDKSTFDSPATPLPGMKAKSLDDTFQYFLMYKPDTPDAIWVPIAKAGWHCKGSATVDAAGTWTISGAGTGGGAGAATTDFPLFTSNAKLNTWEDE